MRYKRYVQLIATMLLCMICVCSCDRRQSDIEQPNPTNEVTMTIQPTIETTPTALVEILELDEQRELSIYSIDSQSAEKISITAMVSSGKEITPEIIVDKVVESMVDETFMIGIDEVTTEGDAVIVSFLDDQPPVTNVGSSVENEILDAIAQSLLDNLDDYHKVIFRIMGGPYQTGHIELDLNTVYMESK